MMAARGSARVSISGNRNQTNNNNLAKYTPAQSHIRASYASISASAKKYFYK